MSCPTSQEIRDFLEGYCIDTEATYSRTGDTVLGSASISDIDTSKLKPEMRISGAGIPSGSTIVSVSADSIVISAVATANGSDVTLTITYYSFISNYWLGLRRDNFVIPFIEKHAKTSLSGETQVTEYYSGNGTNILMLNRRNIESLDAIEYVVGDSTLNTINIQSVELISSQGILKAKSNIIESWNYPVFFKGEKNIKVTYSYGEATCPDDLGEAVIYLVCEQALGVIEGQTGGGDVGIQAYNRGYGPRGKFSHVRSDLARKAYNIISTYSSGVVGR